MRAFGANGYDLDDDSDALQDAFDEAGRRPFGAVVYIPAGHYHTRRTLEVRSGTHVVNRGTIYATAPRLPSVVRIFSASDVRWEGGTVDCNRQPGANGISTTGQSRCERADRVCDSSGDCDGEPCIDPGQIGIWLLDVTIRNCRIGGRAPEKVGNTGGKGFSIQFGTEAAFIDNVLIEDSDIGFSVEGKRETNRSGATQSVQISNVTVRRARYVGAYLFGSSADTTRAGDWFSLNLTNASFDNCAANVSEDFGVLVGVGAHHVTASNVRIRNSHGTTTPIRGVWRESQIEFQADIERARHLIDFTAARGANSHEQASRYFRIQGYFKVRKQASGALVNHASKHRPTNGRLALTIQTPLQNPSAARASHPLGPLLLENLQSVSWRASFLSEGFDVWGNSGRVRTNYEGAGSRAKLAGILGFEPEPLKRHRGRARRE